MSLDSTLITGAPRLRVLTLSGSTYSTSKTLTLPFVNNEGGVIITDVWAKAIKTSLITGGVRFLPGGIRHNVTLTWDLYDPTYTGKVIGTADGQTPNLADLFDLICTYNDGRLAVSPGSSDVWYRVACISDMNREAISFAAYGNLSLTFEGLDVFASTTSTTVVG